MCRKIWFTLFDCLWKLPHSRKRQEKATGKRLEKQPESNKKKWPESNQKEGGQGGDAITRRYDRKAMRQDKMIGQDKVIWQAKAMDFLGKKFNPTGLTTLV